MADAPINLNKARKARARTAAKQKASENRALHGQTKVHKRAEKTKKADDIRKLDGKKLDPGKS